MELAVTHAVCCCAWWQVTETNFSFKSENYELVFDFFGAVDAEKSSWYEMICNTPYEMYMLMCNILCICNNMNCIWNTSHAIYM